MMKIAMLEAKAKQLLFHKLLSSQNGYERHKHMYLRVGDAIL